MVDGAVMARDGTAWQVGKAWRETASKAWHGTTQSSPAQHSIAQLNTAAAAVQLTTVLQ